MYILCTDNHGEGLAEPFLSFSTRKKAEEFQEMLGMFPVHQATRIVPTVDPKYEEDDTDD